MTANEVLVLVVSPIVVLIGFFTLQQRYSVRLWMALSLVILGVTALIFRLSGSPGPAPVVLIGGALVTMVWLLRWTPLVDHPLLQLLLGIPIYLISLMVLLSIAVTVGWVSP